MNKKAGIIGAGNMGQAIAWAMERLGYDLIVVDQSEKAISTCSKILRKISDHRFKVSSNSEYKDCYILKDCDIVISSLPYHQNFNLALFCIDNKIRYCDLGGNVSVSKQINDSAYSHGNTPVMTDLGLAPGWANIIAENLYKEYRVEHHKPPNSIVMMVGGLPKEPINTLKYSCTWSYDGLINEYKEDCDVLLHGETSIQKSMSGLESVRTSIGNLEAFYTSGGAAHTLTTMKSRGVKNCSYKTLRYPGHHGIVNFLIHESGLDDETLIDIFKKTCPPQDDLVVIKVQVDDVLSGSGIISFQKVVKSDKKFSAMQKATAFPIASAAHTIILSHIYKPVLKYDDIEYPQFNKWLEYLFEEVN